MKKRNFEAAHHSAESGEDDELENGGKKKREKLAPKDFVEVERWDRMEKSDTDILAHIREMEKENRGWQTKKKIKRRLAGTKVSYNFRPN